MSYQSFAGYTQEGYDGEPVRSMRSTPILRGGIRVTSQQRLIVHLHVIDRVYHLDLPRRHTQYRLVTNRGVNTTFLSFLGGNQNYPVCPRAPYMAVADASFITLKVSISSGVIRERSSLDDSTPSIKIKGSILAFVWKEVIPRM